MYLLLFMIAVNAILHGLKLISPIPQGGNGISFMLNDLSFDVESELHKQNCKCLAQTSSLAVL